MIGRAIPLGNEADTCAYILRSEYGIEVSRMNPYEIELMVRDLLAQGKFEVVNLLRKYLFEFKAALKAAS